MNIIYLDTDTREVVNIVEASASANHAATVEKFAASLGATVVKIVSTPQENEWRIELKFPSDVRRLHSRS